MNTKPLSKKLKTEVNLHVGEMRKELKETIDSTIQSAIATGMEKLSQSTTVLVQEMFVCVVDNVYRILKEDKITNDLSFKELF